MILGKKHLIVGSVVVLLMSVLLYTNGNVVGFAFRHTGLDDQSFFSSSQPLELIEMQFCETLNRDFECVEPISKVTSDFDFSVQTSLHIIPTNGNVNVEYSYDLLDSNKESIATNELTQKRFISFTTQSRQVLVDIDDDLIPLGVEDGIYLVKIHVKDQQTGNEQELVTSLIVSEDAFLEEFEEFEEDALHLSEIEHSIEDVDSNIAGAAFFDSDEEFEEDVDEHEIDEEYFVNPEEFEEGVFG